MRTNIFLFFYWNQSGWSISTPIISLAKEKEYKIKNQ